MKKTGQILVGTASWSDPGFVAHWYPKGLPASQRLSYYAQHFGLVELNSSFYGIPQRRSVERWCEQTPEGFIFDVKLHKLLSRHSAPLELLPPALRSQAEVKKGRVMLTPKLEAAVLRHFLKEITPFEESGKMGALLLQLSPSFRPKTNQLDELNHLAELTEDKRLAIELRNRDWTTPEHWDETLAWFRRHKVTFVSVDAPASEHFMVMPGRDAVTSRALACLRAHGRNERGYVTGRTVAERFDYDYSDAELQEIADRALEMAEEARETHIVYNNNAYDYAPKAAAKFQQILRERRPESLPLRMRESRVVRAEEFVQREAPGRKTA